MPQSVLPGKIVAGYAARGQGAGPMLVTHRAGLFTKEGLDVEIRPVAGSMRQSAAIMAGDMFFGNMAAPGVISSVLDGADLTFVTGGINQQFVGGRPGTLSLSDVAGGTLAVHRPGELNDALARLLNARLEADGLAPMCMVFDLGEEECGARLIERTIDATILSPPAYNEMRRRGCTVLFDFAECGTNYAIGGIATRRKTIIERPELVKSFVRAYLAGMHRYKTNRELTVSVQQEYSKIEDRTIAEETYDTTEPGMPRAPYPVKSGLEILLGVFKEIDPRANSLTVESLMDDTFVRELDESGYIESLYR